MIQEISQCTTVVQISDLIPHPTLLQIQNGGYLSDALYIFSINQKEYNYIL